MFRRERVPCHELEDLMNIKEFVKNMTNWQMDTWFVYSSFTHDGGGRLEVNGFGIWRVTRKGKIHLTTSSQTTAGQAYYDLMPAELQRDCD